MSHPNGDIPHTWRQLTTADDYKGYTPPNTPFYTGVGSLVSLPPLDKKRKAETALEREEALREYADTLEVVCPMCQESFKVQLPDGDESDDELALFDYEEEMQPISER